MIYPYMYNITHSIYYGMILVSDAGGCVKYRDYHGVVNALRNPRDTPLNPREFKELSHREVR